MRYTDIQMMRKTAAFVPKSVRDQLARALKRARRTTNGMREAVPRSGMSFAAFAAAHDEQMPAIKQLLRFMGLDDKFTKGMRYRGMVQPAVMEIPAKTSTLESVTPVLNPKAVFKPNISVRRMVLGDMLRSDPGSNTSALTTRTPLYAGAPGNVLGPTVLGPSRNPTADVFLSDKYVQKTPQGNPLLDVNANLNQMYSSYFDPKKLKAVTSDGAYSRPARTARRWTSAHTPVDQAYDISQVVRNAEGKVDDIGGFILYPEGTVRKNGYVFTTNVTSNPFTESMRRATAEGAYMEANEVKREWKRNRRRINNALRDYFAETNAPNYDHDAFRRFISANAARYPGFTPYPGGISVQGQPTTLSPDGYMHLLKPDELGMMANNIKK